MSLTKKIAQNTATVLIGKTISTLLGLVAIAIMARHLGVEQFGWYVTAGGFLMFFSIISDFGFVAITASMMAEPKHDKTKLFNTLFTWRLLTAILVNGLAPIIILLFPYPKEVKTAVLILAVSFFFMALTQVFIGYYQSKLKLIIQTSGEILGRIVLVIGLLLLAKNNSGFMPMMAVMTLASAFYLAYMIFKSDGVKLYLDKQISTDIWKKLWPVAIAVMFNAIYLQGDKIILPLYVTQTQMGLYGAAYRVIDILTQSAAMVMGVMMPLITYAWSRQLKNDFKDRLQTSFNMVALVVMPMIAGVIALAEPIMQLVAGNEFIASGLILRWLTLAVIGIVFGMVFGHIALAIGKQKKSMWVFISTAILSLIGYFIFIPRYGVWGAVGVTIFSELYAGICLLILVSYLSKVWPQFGNFAKIVLASTIMGVLVYIIPTGNVVLSIIIGMIIYSILVLLFKIINKATITEVLKTKK